VRCADVTLAIGGRELRVHSQLLAAKSAFFASMWAGEQSAFTWCNKEPGYSISQPAANAAFCRLHVVRQGCRMAQLRNQRCSRSQPGAAGAQPAAGRQVRLLRLQLGRL